MVISSMTITNFVNFCQFFVFGTSVESDRCRSLAYPAMQGYCHEPSGNDSGWLTNGCQTHAKTFVLNWKFFWKTIVRVNITASTKQSFPKYNYKNNPNCRHCHEYCLGKEVNRIHKLQYWHQPNLICLETTQRGSRYKYTDLVYNLEPSVLWSLVQPNVREIYHIHLRIINFFVENNYFFKKRIGIYVSMKNQTIFHQQRSINYSKNPVLIHFDTYQSLVDEIFAHVNGKQWKHIFENFWEEFDPLRKTQRWLNDWNIFVNSMIE